MIHGELRAKRPNFFVDDRVHPQTLAVIRTRAAGFGINVITGRCVSAPDISARSLLQRPPMAADRLCASAAMYRQLRRVRIQRHGIWSARAIPGYRWHNIGLQRLCGESPRRWCKVGVRNGSPRAHSFATTSDVG